MVQGGHQIGVPSGHSGSMQGQQLGIPAQLPSQMHGQISGAQGSHMANRGPGGFPVGYSPQSQLHAGVPNMQGMISRPMQQRPLHPQLQPANTGHMNALLLGWSKDANHWSHQEGTLLLEVFGADLSVTRPCLNRQKGP